MNRSGTVTKRYRQIGEPIAENGKPRLPQGESRREIKHSGTKTRTKNKQPQINAEKRR
jgi:hypothetical protein